jgi:hypothetical protein
MTELHGVSRKRLKITYCSLLIPLLIALLCTIFSNHAFAQSQEPQESCDLPDAAQAMFCMMANSYGISLETANILMSILWLEASAEPCAFTLTSKFNDVKEHYLKDSGANTFYQLLKPTVSFNAIDDKKEFCANQYKNYGPNVENGNLGLLE